MEKKEQIETQVADLRAKIDGKIRFGRALNGYNQNEVNSYISEIKALHEKENKDAADACSSLERLCQELENKNNLLQETVDRQEEELTKIMALEKSQEEQILQLQEQVGAWQQDHDPETVKRLNEENSKLTAALEMRNCEYKSQEKQIQTLEKYNMELTGKLAEAERFMSRYQQEQRRRLTTLRSLEINSLSELQTRLDGCLSFLKGLSGNSAEEWDRIIND